MSINTLVFGAFTVYGIAAFPEYVFGFPQQGNGTTTTCTVQGFFRFVSSYTTLFYYSFFSVYSYVGVSKNFRVSTFGWVEKYIHTAAHLLPLAPAFVNLSTQSYNPTRFGVCGAPVRKPWFCEIAEKGDIPCERGSLGTTYYAASIVLEIIVLLFPAIMMGALYRKVKRDQSEIRLPARSVAIQGLVYLLLLYMVAIPLTIMHVLQWVRDLPNFYMDGDAFVIVVFVVLIAVQCQGFFNLVLYQYFSSEKYHPHDTIIAEGTRRKKTVDAGEEHEIVFGNDPPTAGFSFNIFDGTNASGAFSDFVHDGDEEDEAADEKETEHWNNMQGL